MRTMSDWLAKEDAYAALRAAFADVVKSEHHEFRFFDNPARVDIYDTERQCIVASVHTPAEYTQFLEDEKRRDALLQERISNWDFLRQP